MQSIKMKKCKKCGIPKSVSEFWKQSNSPDGLRYYCKKCISNEYHSYRMKRPLYNIWCGILSRCNNPNDKNYKHYGGRGIKVCERWQIYENFEEDMLPTYEKELQIDRINNDGDYEPNNCHWVTSKENNRNKRSNVVVTAFGEDRLLVELAEEYDIEYMTLWCRIYRYNWNIEKALTTPVQNTITFNGKTMTTIEWSKEMGIPYQAIRRRIDKGWSIDKALTTPTNKANGTPRYIRFNGVTKNIREWSKEIGISYTTLKSRIDKGWSQ
jgi:hypothetical protein